MEKIRVVLADDHPAIREGLRADLASATDIALVAEATNGDEAQRFCREHQPDVLLLDLSMPGPAASETLRFVGEHCPATRVLIVSGQRGAVVARAVVAAGAAGYVDKGDITPGPPDSTLVLGVRAVARGERWFSPSAAPPPA